MKLKKLFFFFLMGACPFSAFSQLKFEGGTLEETLEKAGKKDKLIFVLLPAPPLSAENVVYIEKDKQSSDFFNKHFFNYTAKAGTEEFRAVVKRFQIETYPAYLFLDNQAGLIYKSSGLYSKSSQYINIAEKALDKFKSGRYLGVYEREYDKGNRSGSFLKEYILEKEKLGFFGNYILIEEYVKQIPLQQLESFNEAVFVLKAGPLAYGKIYRLLLSEKTIYDSIYSSLPAAERMLINNRIISNTIKEAIKIKDESLARQGASFARSTWEKDFVRGQKAYQYNMISYYKGTSDTGAFIRHLLPYVDSYYMSITVDSAKKEKLRLAEKEAQNVQMLNRDYGRKIYAKRPVGTSAQLNNFAWDIYLSGTADFNCLTKALLWSRRSIEIEPRPAFYDTLAHILYRMQFFFEAEQMQRKAIKLAEAEGSDAENLKKELKKIQERHL